MIETILIWCKQRGHERGSTSYIFLIRAAQVLLQDFLPDSCEQLISNLLVNVKFQSKI